MPVVGLLATRACAIGAAASIARRGALVRAARAPLIHHRQARAGCLSTRAEVDQTLNPRVAALRPSKTMALTDKAKAQKTVRRGVMVRRKAPRSHKEAAPTRGQAFR